MQSRLYKYAAFFARKPFLTLLTIAFLLVVFTGRNFMNILRTRKTITLETQSEIDYIAENLRVKVTAGDTVTTANTVKITLSNIGHKRISFGLWRIYFYLWSSPETVETAGFDVGWINGGLYHISPKKDKFKGISAGSSIELVLLGLKYISKTSVFPNWYVASSVNGQTSPKIIRSTQDEGLSFVSPFENAVQWKRHTYDMYNPYTPEERYKKNDDFNRQPLKSGINVIPTPFSVETVSDEHLSIDKSWVIVKRVTDELQHISVSRILAAKLGLKEVEQPTQNGKYVEFKSDEKLSEEEYEIKVDTKSYVVFIASSSDKGAFYGVQTLISILELPGTVPEVIIKDHPRFSYRGLMVDVARNFHKKETIKKLIDAMSVYKMNKLHMHLTDDEGWRIEIPSIPELTKYGSRRCNDFENERCLNPSLGSGPNSDTSGSGFYTVSDFREILRYANERYVQVIPEIDIPGHALSAIKAMEFREQDSKQSISYSNRHSYVLSDDVSNIPSVQGWVGDSLNPCLNATYRFVETVITDLKIIYQGIQNLNHVHLGGDEVPHGVWENSRKCQALFPGHNFSHITVKTIFLLRVADIAHRHGLTISAWEDGVYGGEKGPYDINEFKQKEVYVNVWNNIWEWKNGGRAIEFADSGYKTVLSMATHFYFDHPYEPDPEERGITWATRYTDTFKTFGFMPMDIFANAEYDSNGNRIDLEELCEGLCPQIKNPKNVVGMEACVWTETIRNESQLLAMVFPRLLAFAERAWHKADWETLRNAEERENTKTKDFRRFVNILGEKELPRLEKLGLHYRIPPPGFHFFEEKRIVKFNTLFPSHDVMVSLGNGSRWKTVSEEFLIPGGIFDIHAYAVSPVLKRKSRTISLHVRNGAETFYSSLKCIFTLAIISVQFVVK